MKSSIDKCQLMHITRNNLNSSYTPRGWELAAQGITMDSLMKMSLQCAAQVTEGTNRQKSNAARDKIRSISDWTVTLNSETGVLLKSIVKTFAALKLQPGYALY